MNERLMEHENHAFVDRNLAAEEVQGDPITTRAEQESTTNDDDAAANNATLSTAQICTIIRTNMQNMERSLRCPLCLSCYRTATMIGACCHTYCQSCILQALQHKKECPTCKQACTKRSLVPAPHLDALVRAFKHVLRDFGLAPSQFDPSVAVTQLHPDDKKRLEELHNEEEEEEEEENVIQLIEDHDENDTHNNNNHNGSVILLPHKEPDGLTKLPPQSWRARRHRRRRGRRSMSTDWIQVHEHVQAARTFAQHLSTAASSLLQREQAAVVSVNERALVRAAVAVQQAKQTNDTSTTSTSTTANERQADAKPHPTRIAFSTEEPQQHSQPCVVAPVQQQQHHDTTTILDVTLSQQNLEQALEQQTADHLWSQQQQQYQGVEEDDDDDDDHPNPCAMDPADNSQEFFSAREIESQELEEIQVLTNHASDAGRPQEQPQGEVQPATMSTATDPIDTCNNENSSKPTEPELETTTPNDSVPTGEKASSDRMVCSIEASSATNDELNSNVTVRKPLVPTNHADNTDSKRTIPPLSVRPPTTTTHEASIQNPPSSPMDKKPRVPRGRKSSFVPTHAAAGGKNENSPSRAIARPLNYFSVGSIVQVSSRTWPGINKPGGVGRVTRVQFPDDQTTNRNASCLYDIAYILGGREVGVESKYVTANDRALGRDDQDAGSLRIRFNNNIPQSLLNQLEAEGFDTVGRPSLAMMHKAGEESKENVKPFLVEAAKSPKKRLSEEPPPGASHRNKRLKRAKAAVVSTLKSALTKNKSRKQQRQESPPLVLSNAEKCQQANEHYSKQFQDAVQKGVLYVTVSSLSPPEAESVARLCTLSPSMGPVKIKQCDTLSAKVSMCLVPTPAMSRSEPANLVARSRTVKTMRAALAGIPIVPCAWAFKCLQNQTVQEPTPAMYIRTLPTKAGDGHTAFGVAHLASLSHVNGLHRKPLKSCAVYLCGKVPRQVERDIVLLAKDAGATVLTQRSTVLSRIRSEQTVVLLCNKTAQTSLTAKLESEVAQHPKRVLVASAQWLFDSISSGECQTVQAYPPECPVAHTLWTMTSAAASMTQTSYFGTTEL